MLKTKSRNSKIVTKSRITQIFDDSIIDKKKCKTIRETPLARIDFSNEVSPQNKSKRNINYVSINFSIDQSQQFSPLRQINSKKIIKSIETKRIGTQSPKFLNKSPTNHMSYVSFLKNHSLKVLGFNNNRLSPRFLSPRILSTRQNHPKKIKNQLEEEKIWRKAINSSNGIECQPQFISNYSIFVGKGNNSALIKRIFSLRNWWTVTEIKERAHFVWTQWKDKGFLSELPCCSIKEYNINIKDSKIIKPQLNQETGINLIINSSSYISLIPDKITPEQVKLHNKLENNQVISNKKDLFLTLKSFYDTRETKLFTIIPLTFHISQGPQDIEFQRFSQRYFEYENFKQSSPNFQNLWIIKPGENSNRGQGIKVCKSLDEISTIVSSTDHTFIVQKYIENPLLFCKRKFDIRCYSLITSINGILQCYFYLDGYLRTTSHEYNTKDTNNLFVHLTNDAIQKHSKEYGKFENGNKLSYNDFQRYLDRRYPEIKINFYKDILPKIKNIVKDTVKSCFQYIDINKRLNSMEIFGYDFMIDRKFAPWLIEINTNPCLELSSKYLATLIPNMLENAFKIAIDTIFPPPIGEFLNFSQKNRFELIFHELVDSKIL